MIGTGHTSRVNLTSHSALDCIKHLFVRRTGSRVLLVGALPSTTHALPPASLWFNHSTTRMVGLGKAPAISLGKSTLCSGCASADNCLLLLWMSLSLILNALEGRGDEEENHSRVEMIVCWVGACQLERRNILKRRIERKREKKKIEKTHGREAGLSGRDRDRNQCDIFIVLL